MSKKEEKEAKANVVQTARLKGLVDICLDERGRVVFLMKEDEQLVIKERHESDGHVFVPPEYSSMPWELPRAKEVIRYYSEDNDQKVLADIEDAIRSNCYLSDERYYHFLAAWVVHTHLLDKFNYSPMIILYAVAARGKSRTGRTILWQCRRGLYTESIRQADMIRKSDRFMATYFFDVVDVWKRAEKGDAEDILLSRFDKGIKTARVLKADCPGFGDTQHFRCFGATILATNESTNNSYLDSRAITITMQKTSKAFEDDPREEDFLPMRERATALRARWLGIPLPKIAKPEQGRLGDILRPIAQIYKQFGCPEKFDEFQELILSFGKEHAESLSDTLEGRIIEVLIEMQYEAKTGGLMVEAITKQLNEKRASRFPVNPITVGKKLKALGFEATKIKGERSYIYNTKLLGELKEQYGLVDKQPRSYEVSALEAYLEGTDDNN